jgi:hypothetical protein
MTKSKLSVFVTALLLSNFILAIWHLYILQNVYPGGPESDLWALVPIVGSISLLGIVLLWTRFFKVGACVAAGLFLVGLTIGSYEHFVSVNPNNIFIMKPGIWFLPFLISVMLLVVVELLGIWASVRSATVRA